MSNNRLFTMNFILLTISSFFYFFNLHGYILLPVKIKILGGTESDIGFIMGAASLSTIISTPLAGYLVDRYKRKKIMFVGAVLLIISGLFLITLKELNFYYSVLRFTQGISFSLFFVSAGTLVTDFAPESRRTQALGIFGVFTVINYAIAPYIGRLISEYYGFDTLFIFLSLFGILSIIFLLPVHETLDFGSSTSGQSAVKYNNYLNYLSYKILVPALILFIIGSGFIPTLTFLPVFSLGMGIKEYEIFFIAYTLSVLGVRIFVGWVPDRIGKVITLYPSLIIFSIGILYLGYSSEKTDLIICAVLFGVGHGFLYPTLYAIIIENGNPSMRGKLFSISSVSFTFGGMAGSFLYGIFAEHYDFYHMYRLMGTICISGLILLTYYRYRAYRKL